MAIQEHAGAIIGHFGSAIKEGTVFAASVLEDIFRHEMSLDEIAKLYNNELDLMIINETKVNALKYVGGSFFIKHVSNSFFSMSFELYFQNSHKGWVKKSSDSQPQPIKFLTIEARNELKNIKEIQYEIEEPDYTALNAAEKVGFKALASHKDDETYPR